MSEGKRACVVDVVVAVVVAVVVVVAVAIVAAVAVVVVVDVAVAVVVVDVDVDVVDDASVRTNKIPSYEMYLNSVTRACPYWKPPLWLYTGCSFSWNSHFSCTRGTTSQ